jgi:MFS family permease
MPRVLWLIPGIYMLLVTGEFLAMTQLALSLTERGASALAVGVLASSFWLGILAASLRAERLIARLGQSRSFIAAMAVSTAAFGLLAFQDSYAGWLAGAIGLGLAGGVLWVDGEAWLAEAAPAARRGFFVGLFQTAVGVGLVGGPALLTLLHGGPLAPLSVSFALALAALALAALGLRGQDVASRHAEASAQADRDRDRATDGARRAAWPLVSIATIAGILEVGSGALMPSISLRLQSDAQAAAWLGALIGLGSALLPTPSGLLADRIGLRRVMLGGWLLLATATAVLAVAAASLGRAAAPLLWPVGFVLGGMGATIYTLVIIDFGHRFTGTALLRAMALLVTGYTAGTSLGPVIGGALFDAAGLTGLAAGLFASSVAGCVLAWRATPRPAPSALARQAA